MVTVLDLRIFQAMAPHSRTLAWKVPWMEEPGTLQSMESLRVGHDWVTSLSLFTFMHWRRKWQPTPVFLPGESQGWGSLVAAVYGVTQSQIRLKWLSSSTTIIGSISQAPLHIMLTHFPQANKQHSSKNLWEQAAECQIIGLKCASVS